MEMRSSYRSCGVKRVSIVANITLLGKTLLLYGWSFITLHTFYIAVGKVGIELHELVELGS